MDLYVEEHGPVDGETIVFLHGGGGAGWMWRPQVEGLPEYHLLVPDLPEHGRSAAVRPFTIAGSAEAVADLIRTRAHGGRATVVGLSEGAQIVVALLASRPEVVERAIVSSALVRPMPGARMMSPGLVAWTYRLTVAPFKDSERWMRANMKGAAGVPEEFVDDFRRTFKETTAGSFANVIAENQAFRLPTGLDRVTAPVLAVCGHGEYEVMRRSTADVAGAIPGARAYEVFHDRQLSLAEDHNWSMNDPRLFTDMVRSWMTGAALPEGLRPLAGGAAFSALAARDRALQRVVGGARQTVAPQLALRLRTPALREAAFLGTGGRARRQCRHERLGLVALLAQSHTPKGSRTAGREGSDTCRAG